MSIAAAEAVSPRRSSWRSPGLMVAVISTAYACVVTYPLVLNLGTMIYGYPGDATGTVAQYEWWSYAIHHHLSIFDNTSWGAPYGAGWQAVPFAAIPVIVFAPLSALVGGIGAYNVEVLTAFPLTAWTTYLVARRFGCWPLAAMFSGLSFTFIPYHIEKAQGHAGQTHMELFSATLLFLLRWRQGGSRWNLAAAGGIAGLTLWNDFYFAFIEAFMVATFFAVSFFYRKESQSWTARLRTHVVAGLVVGIVTALFVPLTVALAERPTNGSFNGSLSAQAAGFNQSLEEIRVYTARPLEFLLPYHANPLVPKSIVSYEISRLHGSNFTEQSLFIGYTVMALGGLWVLAGWRRFETILLLAIGAVGFAISMPPGLNFHGLVVPTPSLLLHPLFPIFRVYSRFGILVLLGAAILAGLGLSWIQERLNGRAALLIAVPFLLTALEFNSLPPTHVTQILPPPAEYQWLASQPAGIVIEYPLRAGTSQEQEIQTHQYQLYQPLHGHPIFNGATPASQADRISPFLEPYYGHSVADMLHVIGIRYVLVHREDYLRDGYLLPTDVPGLNYTGTINGVDIYEVT